MRELVSLLAQHNVGALIVSTDGSSVDGIVSERDVVRRLHSDDGVLEGPVSAIMTAQVRSCAPDATVDSLMAMMTEHRIRHVPVVTDGRLIGIISIGDVVKSGWPSWSSSATSSTATCTRPDRTGGTGTAGHGQA